jgi:hypothetical protein
MIGVGAEARRPLLNEISFCEKENATSQAFLSTIIAEHSDWYEMFENEMLRYVQ